MAVTLDAPPRNVWPWLVQMGAGRAGWYSWDRLDDFGARSAERLHPEWQDVSLGDRLPATPDGSQWWEVAVLEPERFLGLRMSLDLRGRPFDPDGAPPSTATDSLWGFRLIELPGSRTRLVVSGYWAMRPGWLRLPMSVLFLEPSHWVMQTRQFANLRRRVEPPSPSPASGRATVSPFASIGPRSFKLMSCCSPRLTGFRHRPRPARLRPSKLSPRSGSAARRP